MSEPIMHRLRAETRAQHVATEAIPFSSSILAGTLSREAYAGQLAAYLPVHRAIETAVATSRHPALAEVWTADMRRTPLLKEDLAVLGATTSSARAARAEGQSMAAWIAGLAGGDPVAILGVLYVMEGSTLGGAVLRRHLARAFDLADAGLRYYSPYGTHPKPHWAAFSHRMNQAVTDEADGRRVVTAAAETFDRIGRILAALSSPRQVAAAV
ncbi:MAG TPA: biliverdin-producing heme oxygenase [Candidatus Limnocylindria bacterium]|jgi:heme oxygenase